jgi:hypothetical protein
MSRGFSYIITRDFGFAPNPFHGVLTLATCKPKIRKTAQVGDYLIGNSNKANGNKLIYMAKVDEITTFDQYWVDQCKKATMNGSFKTLYGDNIYHHEGEMWIQANSHHSLENGMENHANLEKDTGITDQVLICREFFYLGRSMIDIAHLFPNCVHWYIGHHEVAEADCIALWKYLEANYPERGLIEVPNLFRSFTRYNGK